MLIPWCIAIMSGLLGALCDVRTRRIPNRLTMPVMLCGVIWHAVMEGPGGLGKAILAAAIVALPYLILFFLKCGGAGDAKLMAALGAWLSLPASFILLATVALAGGVLGLGYSLWRGQAAPTIRNLGQMGALVLGIVPGFRMLRDWAGRWPAPGQMTRMPYGVAIFTGACLAAAGVWVWN